MDSKGRIGNGFVFLLAALVTVIVSGVSRPSLALDAGAGLHAKLSVLQNQDLKGSLHDLVDSTHRTSLDYRSARQAVMGDLHLQKSESGYFIRDVYCLHDYTVSDFKGGESPKPGKIPDDRILNVEHTWPQSRFGGEDKRYQKSDLHHLFPADSVMNARRGNMKFGDVDGRSEDLKCRESRLSTGPGGPRFEPPDSHKGNVARALFYFSVRYNMKIDADEEKTLRSWDKQDPVDDAERERNDKIEKLQGNRNPFIDHPEYIDRISDF